MTQADSLALDVWPVDSALLRAFRREHTAARSDPLPVFTKYLPLLGAKAMLDYLEQTYPGCHAESHELGRLLYTASGDLGTALRRCDTRCTSGCMHGVVTAAFGATGLETITARMDSFCASAEMSNLHKPGNCAHGLGHALMFVTAGNVARSIDSCLGFAAEALQFYCGTGVFMDRFIRDTGKTDLRSILAPCDEEALFPGACYRYRGFDMIRKLGDSAAAAACAALEGLQRHGCFHGLGYGLMGKIYGDPEKLTALCGATEREDQLVCIEGVIEKLAEVHEGRARGACAFLDDPELQRVCNQAVERKMYGVGKPTFALYFDREALARRRAAVAPGRRPPPRHHH